MSNSYYEETKKRHHCIRSLTILNACGDLNCTKHVIDLLKEKQTWDEENQLLIFETPSTPESRAYLSTIDWADVWLTSKRIPYIASWNMMIKRENAQYYILVHNDLIDIPQNFREILIKEVEADGTIGVVQMYDKSANLTPGFHDWCITGCTLYKREVFKNVGLFDEEFDPHFDAEDQEFGTRVRNFGYKILVTKEGEIKHMQHGIRHFKWAGDGLFLRKKDLTIRLSLQKLKRNDVEYLNSLPVPSGLRNPEEEKKEYYPNKWDPSSGKFVTPENVTGGNKDLFRCPECKNLKFFKNPIDGSWECSSCRQVWIEKEIVEELPLECPLCGTGSRKWRDLGDGLVKCPGCARVFPPLQPIVKRHFEWRKIEKKNKINKNGDEKKDEK